MNCANAAAGFGPQVHHASKPPSLPAAQRIPKWSSSHEASAMVSNICPILQLPHVAGRRSPSVGGFGKLVSAQADVVGAALVAFVQIQRCAGWQPAKGQQQPGKGEVVHRRPRHCHPLVSVSDFSSLNTMALSLCFGSCNVVLRGFRARQLRKTMISQHELTRHCDNTFNGSRFQL